MQATPLTVPALPSSQAETTLKTIVVATDFSESASAALHWATAAAHAHTAKLILVHALDTELPALAEAHGPIGTHVQQMLETTLSKLAADNVRVQAKFDVGKPWSIIANVAKEANADLIVLGAHGMSRLSERVLGTVADRVVRMTSIPVLVYRSKHATTANKVRTVLAATDFSEEAAKAVSTVVRILHGFSERVRLVLFHAIPLLINYVDYSAPVMTTEYWDEQERLAAQRLATLAASLQSDRLQVETQTFRGYPADAILQQAEVLDADLIAIGSVGRTGLGRLLMGSVAERVLRQARCPVLAVRMPDPAEPIRLSVE